MIFDAAGGVIQTMCFHALYHKKYVLLADDSITFVKGLNDSSQETSSRHAGQ
jgi:hypothetical protein